ncbi:hypothetical protein [Longitalea arenae]|uniref:hypothetical protein n=1 Tax=Longitalea arenae TaxID=2812558 RepID=UPI0019673B44|nr:hypothetical protein [Longitalea arenae]
MTTNDVTKQAGQNQAPGGKISSNQIGHPKLPYNFWCILVEHIELWNRKLSSATRLLN